MLALIALEPPELVSGVLLVDLPDDVRVVGTNSRNASVRVIRGVA